MTTDSWVNVPGSPKSAALWGNLLGLPADEAEKRLRAEGFEIIRREYSSKRGVEGADSERVIRIRAVGNNSVEMLISRFKTVI